MTFADYVGLSILWSRDSQDSIKAMYESMRIQTYFSYVLVASKKAKKPFERFCKDYMSFTWDKKLEDSESQKVIENFTPDDWAERDRQRALRQSKTVTATKATAAML